MPRDGAAAARMAHNHEVPGSSPGPATISTFTSVIMAEVFVYLKYPPKLTGSSPVWHVLAKAKAGCVIRLIG